MHPDQSPLLLIATVLTLVLASCEDLARHRISNILVLCALSAGLILNASTGGWSGLGASLLGVVIGLGLLMPLHVLSGLAAGDVKLMGAIGSLVGPIGVAWSVAYTLIAGALFALVYVSWKIASLSGFSARAMAGITLTWRDNLMHLRKERFPYALAVTAGTIFAMWQSGAFAYVTGGGTIR